MLNIILSGANGKMGKILSETVRERDDVKIIFGIDVNSAAAIDYPIFAGFYEQELSTNNIDCLIDFSHPSNLKNILDFVMERSMPLVLSTTGFNDDDRKRIDFVARHIPVFFSANMSLGVNLLVELAKKASEILGEQFNIEIIEKHHNQKIDSPSGTAYMIADAINESAENKYNYRFNRQILHEKRSPNEIGIHSVRGGTIVGEHEVIFAGNDEIITLSHSAFSRKVFANGAINAAKFIASQSAGLYSMTDMI